MQMARRGKTYKDIIHHYFKGVKIVNYFETFKSDTSILHVDEGVQ